MAVNKKTIKNTEEVVNETNKEQIAENAFAVCISFNVANVESPVLETKKKILRGF